MRILQAGVAKSGNFWLYTILQNILEQSQRPRTTFIQTQPIHAIAKTWELSYQEQADIDVIDIEPHACFYRISSIFKMPIADLDAYLESSTHLWTHSPICSRSFEVFPKCDRIVYIIRDPRSVALSSARFAFTPYMQQYYPTSHPSVDEFLEQELGQLVTDWVTQVATYLKYQNKLNIYIIFYEQLLADFESECRQLLDYLGIDLGDDQITQLRQAVSLETMKKRNPNHVRHGQSMEWQVMLSPTQKKRVRAITAPLLDYLSYPLDDQIVRPQCPTDLDEPWLDRAIAHAQKQLLFQKGIRRFKKLIKRPI